MYNITDYITQLYVCCKEPWKNSTVTGKAPESNGEEPGGLPQLVAVFEAFSLHFISELLNSCLGKGYHIGVHKSKQRGNELRGITKLKTIYDKPVCFNRDTKRCSSDRKKNPLILAPFIQL